MSEKIKDRLFLVYANGDGEDQRLVRGGIDEIIKAFIEITWLGSHEEALKEENMGSYVASIKDEWIGQHERKMDFFEYFENGEQCHFGVKEIFTTDPLVEHLESELSKERAKSEKLLKFIKEIEDGRVFGGACSSKDPEEIIAESIRYFLKETEG